MDGDQDFDDLACRFGAIACEAGAAIMAVYAADFAVVAKSDGSPVTLADAAAEAIILARLRALLPGIPIVAEEEVSAGSGPGAVGGTFLLVDPLDGTREFVARNGEFTVNIALVRNKQPRAGAVYVPAQGRLYVGGASAQRYDVAPGQPLAGAGCAIAARCAPGDGVIAAVSRSHGDGETERFLATLPVRARRQVGSSVKFCAIAEGAVDVYPRFGPTMEWDIAAGHAVLAAAGGRVLTPAGDAVSYGKPGHRQGPFVAWGRAVPE